MEKEAEGLRAQMEEMRSKADELETALKEELDGRKEE